MPTTKTDKYLCDNVWDDFATIRDTCLRRIEDMNHPNDGYRINIITDALDTLYQYLKLNT